MERISIGISNCNNINHAEVSLVENELNIKYAFNGTGKSTIAEAIDLKSRNCKLDILTPFSLKATKSKEKPSVSDIPYHNVKIFNSDYISKSVFQKTNLVNDSFEIFIRTEEYDSLKDKIDSEFENIRKMAAEKDSVIFFKKAIDSLSTQAKLTSNQELDQRKSGIKQVLDSSKTAFSKTPDALS